MKYIKIYTLLFFLLVAGVSCVNDLDTVPLDDDSQSSEQVYSTLEGYYGVLAKCYAGLALTGQQGAAGQGDLGGIDEGASSYVRGFWHMQCLPTDVAIVAWQDVGVPDFHAMNWVASNPIIQGFFYRVKYQITLCNELIRECNNAAGRGISDGEIDFIRGEAQFLRALSYYHGVDLFGGMPFCDETTPIGAGSPPPYYTRQQIYDYIETQLLLLDTGESLRPVSSKRQGRVDMASVWLLLAKLYANAEVFTGTANWDDCAIYAQKAIDSGYQLNDIYEHLFLADNDQTDGVLLNIYADGENATSFGSTTYILSASIGGDMNSVEYGTQNAWAGNRSMLTLTDVFDINFEQDIAEQTESDILDKRAMFYRQAGQVGTIDEVTDFVQGVHVVKFKNLDIYGNPGKRLDFPDIDFPMLRIADAYLLYAEAFLQGAAGTDQATALGYVNQVRARAYRVDGQPDTGVGDIVAGELTLDWLLEERAREFYWEGYRRTDLIRFGRWVSGYDWPWKAGVVDGQDTEEFRKVYPIPSSELNANPGLIQNPGY